MWDARRKNRPVDFLAPETIPTSFRRRVLCIPNDMRIIAAVNEVIAYLSRPKTWKASDGVSDEDMQALMTEMFLGYLREEDYMIGQLVMFFTDIIPDNCLLMDGATYDRVDYPDLYTRVPAAYRDTEAETFTLPDMSGLFPMGETEDEPLGTMGGEAQVTLTESQLAAHTHTDAGHVHTTHTHSTLLAVEPGEALVTVPPLIPPYFEYTGSGNADIQATGGDEAHENRPPFLTIKFAIIALKGGVC